MPGKDRHRPIGKGTVFHLCRPEVWPQALIDKVYAPPSLDQEGYIHFSEFHEVIPSARLYFKDVPEVWMLHVQESQLSPDLKWEKSRDDKLFPHLYRPLYWHEVHSISVLSKTEESWVIRPYKE